MLLIQLENPTPTLMGAVVQPDSKKDGTDRIVQRVAQAFSEVTNQIF